MGRRTLLLVAALFLAAVGTGVLFVSVRGVAGATGQSSDEVDVYAPTATIPGGTTINDPNEFTTVRVPKSVAEQAGMVTRYADVKEKIANRDLLPLVPVTQGQFGGAVSGAPKIGVDGDLMAMTVDMEDPARVAGLLGPGSRVAIWVIDPAPRGDGATHEARLFLTDVKVITTGSSATITSPTPQDQAQAQGQERGSSALVTLQVDQDQAGAIMVADAAGDLYFTLLSGDAKPIEKTYDQNALAAAG
jgi:pilus assembly protein CpaB